MYLILSKEKAVDTRKIIGIFDIDKTTVRTDTRDFLNAAEKEGRAETLSFEEIPLTFVVCSEKEKKDNKVYISPVSVSTLEKRLKSNY